LPLVDFVTAGRGGRATIFMYGQTGSGKTFTMNGIQHILCHDLYSQLQLDTTSKKPQMTTTVTASFFELYGGFIQDLLNERTRCKLLEDGKGEVQILGLQEYTANSPKELLDLVEKGNK
jgi:kinesin family protein 2/24